MENCTERKKALKIQRRNRKGTLTRSLSVIRNIAEEGRQDDVHKRIDKSDLTLESIEEAHSALVELIEDEDEYAQEEGWMENCQQEYVKEIQEIKKKLSEMCSVKVTESNENNNNDRVNSDEVDGNVNPNDGIVNVNITDNANANANNSNVSENNGLNDWNKLVKALTLPKTEVTHFNGDPLKYHSFVTAFDSLMSNVNDDRIRLNSLLKFCTGKANDALQSCLMRSPEEGYPLARKILKERFGNTGVIVQTWVTKIISRPRVEDSNLREFSDDLCNCYDTLNAMGYVNELNNQRSLKMIIDKLARHLQTRWVRENHKLKCKRDGANPVLKDVVEFVKLAAEEASDPVFGITCNDKSEIKGTRLRDARFNDTKYDKKSTVLYVNGKESFMCYVCNGKHWTDQCETFLAKRPAERLEVVKMNHACFSCLKKAGRDHRLSTCRRRRQCTEKINDKQCTSFHHPLLHYHQVAKTVGVALSQIGDSMLPIITAEFVNNYNVQRGNVLLDSGAQISLIRQGLAEKLKLKGRNVSVNIMKVGGEEEQLQTKLYKVKVRSVNGGKIHEVEAVGLPEITEHTYRGSLAEIAKALCVNSREFVREGGPVDLLVGVDHPKMHTGDTREVMDYIARKSPLGWVVFGTNGTMTSKVNQVLHVQVSSDVDLRQFWSTENMGVSVKCDCKPRNMTTIEKEEHDIIWNSCKKLDKQWEVSYPWKDDPNLLPNNRKYAEKMLNVTERKLERNAEHAKLYQEQMDAMVEMNFARKLTEGEMAKYTGPVYYVSHHGVLRPEKKSTPLRIVFNSSARFNGSCLNDHWLKGPDLLNNLIGVILRFRENRIAICADISKMYHRIRIPESDQHVHRYLWRDLDKTRKPDVYVKTVITFGDKPAPAMAQIALRKTAEDGRDLFPKAADAITRDTYMDDICTSKDNVEAAIQLTKDIDRVLDDGGFNVKGWISNANLQCSDDDTQLEGTMQTVMEEKILGLVWDNRKDELSYKVKSVIDVNGDGFKLTKRQVLREVAKIFDPVGFAAAFIIKAKIGMQRLWELGLDWDETIPEPMATEWIELFNEMKRLNNVTFPRCLSPLDTVSSPILVIFCDASEKAFGTCAYLRWEVEGEPRYTTRFVAARSRVAPLKQLTIPRLELQAAVLAVRLHETIMDETRLKIQRTIFFTDSTIVYGWIRSESRRFKQFVSARIGEIHSKSSPSQWKHVPGELNPADDVSRGITVEMLSDRWLVGPAFLKLPLEEWPKYETTTKCVDSTEFKKSALCANVTVEKPIDDIEIENYRTWDELVESYGRKIYRSESDVLTAQQLKDVELKLLQQVQRDSFPEEFKDLQEKKNVKASSRLVQLAPEIDESMGIIRVGGRLRKIETNDLEPHPIVLDPSHHITKLLVRKVDSSEFSHQAGHEQIFARLRRRYWILKGRSMIKSMVRQCRECQRWRKKAEIPVMADLPNARLRIGKPAFYSTGVDCFGPMNVKVRRSTEKRWGVVFKCMTTRAVHLEVIDSMDTDAFLMAFQRFVARRGKPKELYSDCGTNFRGAEKELCKSFEAMSDDLRQKLASQQVEFKFNPPGAPHFGGIWEREVRSIKNALRCSLNDRLVTDVVLRTVFTEAESVMNSKPLGYASSDVADPDPITPNLLLMGRRDTALPLVIFNEEEIRSRRHWRHSQIIADQFWRRFMTEYLPSLQLRQKWYRESGKLKVEDVVLVIDSQQPRAQWLIGKVTKVYTGEDGRVRVAEVIVKDTGKTYKRPVAKLVKLDQWKDGEENSS